MKERERQRERDWNDEGGKREEGKQQMRRKGERSEQGRGQGRVGS